VALEAYFDGAHIGQGWTDGSLVTLAGFAAEETIWAEFDRNWRAILGAGKKAPKAKNLHLTDAVHLKKEFSYRNGWNLNKVFSLIMELLMYLQTIDKQRLRQFACTVDLAAHRKMVAEGYKLGSPIEICIDHCPYAVLAWYSCDFPGLIHSAHYFFDQNEPFEEPFRQRWIKEQQKMISPGGLDMFWSVIPE